MNNGTILHDLLCMDDVALVHENANKLQMMLDTTNHVAMKYHVEFGAPNCKVVKCGSDRKSEIELNGQTLEYMNVYKNLGDMNNSKDNLDDQTKNLKGRITTRTQVNLAERWNKELRANESNLGTGRHNNDPDHDIWHGIMGNFKSDMKQIETACLWRKGGGAQNRR